MPCGEVCKSFPLVCRGHKTSCTLFGFNVLYRLRGYLIYQFIYEGCNLLILVVTFVSYD